MQFVQAGMAAVAYVNAGSQSSFVVVLFKVLTSMQLSWNEMMERKVRYAHTQFASSQFLSCWQST